MVTLQTYMITLPKSYNMKDIQRFVLETFDSLEDFKEAWDEFSNKNGGNISDIKRYVLHEFATSCNEGEINLDEVWVSYINVYVELICI